MRQLGLACMNFESARMRLPKNGMVGASPQFANPVVRFGPSGFPYVSTELASWAMQILPQMEQQNLASQRDRFGIDNSAGSPPAGLIPMQEQTVPSMTCPFRGARFITVGTVDRLFNGDYASFTAAFGPNQFRAPSRPLVGPAPFVLTEAYYSGVIAKAGLLGEGSAGAFTRYGGITFGSISDGSSNTLLLGEKSVDARNYNPQAPSIAAVQSNDFLGEGAGLYDPQNHTNSRFAMPPPPDSDTTSPNRNPSARSIHEQTFGVG